ncbi:MAG TPA: TfoX/Sxy family protein [Candidatus Binatus sp.]|nr:TfoX/Sxy family protein [Candidatus Binatus sp.]
MPKSSSAMVELFAQVVPGPPVVQRKMFGYPSGFVNGNLFMGLYGDGMILRLPDAQREDLIKKKGARQFEPMPGRPMREYVLLPASMLRDRRALSTWIERALNFAAEMKPKAKKPTKAAAKPKARTKRR